jgi:hypothetical protein
VSQFGTMYWFDTSEEDAVEKNPSFDMHPSEEILEEYCFNRLPETATDAIEEHLLLCAGCQVALQDLDEYILLMKLAAAEHNATPVPSARAAAASGGLEQVRAGVAKLGLIAKATWGTGLVLASVLGLIFFRTTPAQMVSAVPLSAFRGGEDVAITHALAASPLDLQADITDLPGAIAYRIEVVDRAGRPVWDQTVPVSSGTLSAHLPKGLGQGVYWVRLYSGSGALLREFGLRLDDPSRHR